MEPPASLINKIISVCLLDPRIEAIILTGSRGQEQHIDYYSDIDIELIGLGASELFNEKYWPDQFGQAVITLHLENKGEDEPDWPTCLVILEQGRKIDFTFAEPSRLQQMKQAGLDETYVRGYSILLDKTGITNGLPDYSSVTLKSKQLTKEQFTNITTNFWFDAHQTAIALSRNEIWSAWSRDVDMKKALLAMCEILVSAKSHGQQDVWYHGKNYHLWMPQRVTDVIKILFDYRNAKQAGHSLFELMACFNDVTVMVGEHFDYPIDKRVSENIQTFVTEILQDNRLLPENI